MKKHAYISLATAAILAISPIITFAEEGQVPLPMPGRDGDQSRQLGAPDMPPGPNPALRQRIRDNYQNQVQHLKTNIRNNEDTRNEMLERRREIASSTHATREDIRDERRDDIRGIRTEERKSLHDATSTEDRREIRVEARLDIFKVRQDALVRQLTLSLSNLKQIRERVSSRIAKLEASSTDMTQAKADLATADAKISAAEAAINGVKSYVPPAPQFRNATSTEHISDNANATTSAIVNLDKPRKVGEAAIKAIKDARDALKVVVRDIAHTMGNDVPSRDHDENTTSTTSPQNN